MKVTETEIKGCYIIESAVFKDERGLFYELYHQEKPINTMGLNIQFVQDNHSVSKKGVLRGLHFQKGEFAQAKLVRVVTGSVLDVVVNIRPESSTFGQHIKVQLTGENNKSIFIPKGMAHGFLSLEDDTVFVYKCDNYYNTKDEGGVAYNDPDLGIDWEFPEEKIFLAIKDKEFPRLKNLML
ncbi:MAG: dTDP-4-dehydrorhamnose 3,5-epimerase [Cellulophaga sp.]